MLGQSVTHIIFKVTWKNSFDCEKNDFNIQGGSNIIFKVMLWRTHHEHWTGSIYILHYIIYIYTHTHIKYIYLYIKFGEIFIAALCMPLCITLLYTYFYCIHIVYIYIIISMSHRIGRGLLVAGLRCDPPACPLSHSPAHEAIHSRGRRSGDIDGSRKGGGVIVERTSRSPLYSISYIHKNIHKNDKSR
jgi:hypothetical protein